jgi:hypothetical protein
MYSFYAHRSQKRKKIQLSHKYLFTLSGSTSAKAVLRTLMKLTPGVDFKSVFSCAFCANILVPKITKLCFGFENFGVKISVQIALVKC